MRYIALLLLLGCTTNEDLLTPDEFRVDYGTADLDHDNSNFDGDQTRVGVGLTWAISGRQHEAEDAVITLPEKVDELIEGVQLLQPPPSPEPSEESDLLKLLITAGGASVLTGGGMAGYKKIRS